jgi:biotin transport system permease protein
MNPLTSSYVARDSFLHRIHPGPKVLLLILYAGALFSCNKPWQVTAFLVVIALTTLLLGLPLKFRIGLGVAILLIIAVSFLEPVLLLQQIVLAIGKVVALNLMISLFNMTTRTRDLVALLASVDNVRRYFGPLLFTVSTMITVTPTIERDIQRAIDTETLRRGTAPSFFSLNAWAAILVILLSRVLKRADALTAAILDRGFSLSSLVSFTNHWQSRWQDVPLTFLLALPAMAILFAP